MAQAHIYWEMEDYSQAEALLDQCSDVCQDHGVWRCNLAHAIFMQGRRPQANSHHESTLLSMPLLAQAGFTGIALPSCRPLQYCLNMAAL